MKYRLLFSFVLLVLCVSAQPPGYMGKHLTIGYSNNFMLAAMGPGADGSVFNSAHSINLEYTVKNRTNLCLSFQSAKSAVEDHQIFDYYIPDQYGETHVVTYRYIGHPMELQSTIAAIGLKFFPHGSLAPVGKYKKLEFLLFFNHLTYNNSAFVGVEEYTNQTFGYIPPKKKIGTGDYMYKTFAFTYAFGKQRVFFNCIVLDYGMRIGIVPSGLIPLINDESISLISDMSPENLFKHDTNARLLRSQLFNLHIGIGFLAI